MINGSKSCRALLLLGLIVPGFATSANTLLPVGTVEGGLFGYKFRGQTAHRDGVTFAFESNGRALAFTYTGHDIDVADEVRVRLNGTEVGFLATTPNNGQARGSLALPLSAQMSGTNTLEFVQRRPGWVWGITDLLLTAAPAASLPELTAGTVESGLFGYRFRGQSAHRDGVTFEFESNGQSLVLTYEAHDIDVADEVRVRLNGTEVGFLATTPNNGEARSSLVLPLSAQVPGTNTLEFVQRRPGWVWGITDLLLEPHQGKGGGGSSISVLEALGATVTVELSGAASVRIDLDSRRIASPNVFHVDSAFNGNGSRSNPFNDLPDAFTHIDDENLTSAIIHVADGDYSWGDTIDPKSGSARGFNASLAVIGNGSGNTRVLQGSADAAAAVFKERGRSLYLEGIEFVGLGAGGASVNEDVLEARNGADLTLVDVILRDASNGDGLYVLNFDTVVVLDSRALDNEADGFSYAAHGGSGDPLYVLEAGVTATGNGRNGQPNSQGSTMHRATEIVRVNGLYANNPTNIEDTGLVSWNINLTVRDSTVFQAHEGDYVNFRVRGDKIELTDGLAWLISGSYSGGGVAHAHTTSARAADGRVVPINSAIRYSSLFDIAAHSPSVLFADSGSAIVNPADDTYSGTLGR